MGTKEAEAQQRRLVALTTEVCSLISWQKTSCSFFNGKSIEQCQCSDFRIKQSLVVLLHRPPHAACLSHTFNRIDAFPPKKYQELFIWTKMKLESVSGRKKNVSLLRRKHFFAWSVLPRFLCAFFMVLAGTVSKDNPSGAPAYYPHDEWQSTGTATLQTLPQKSRLHWKVLHPTPLMVPMVWTCPVPEKGPRVPV